MIHPATELRWISEKLGNGVVATRAIPRGTILWTQCEFDIVLSRPRLAALPDPYKKIAETYGYVDHRGDTILCWDLGRFVNHACVPAMLPVDHHIEICVRDLAPGDELTCDYGSLNYDQHLICHCNHPECRGTIAPEDVLAVGDAWLDSLRDALRVAPEVPQPLVPYLRFPQDWDDFLAGRKALPRSVAFYFSRTGVGA